MDDEWFGDSETYDSSNLNSNGQWGYEEATVELRRLQKILEEREAREEELVYSHKVEITNTTDALIRERYLLDSVNALRPKYKPIHDIALRLVFEATIPPEGFLNPQLGLGYDSPWERSLRTRKALTLVCRQWYNVAYPFLYRDIVIRRVGQIASLGWTLRQSPKYYAEIRRLTLLCYVPEIMRDFAQTSVSALLISCTSLQSLSVGPTFSAMLDCLPCVACRPLSRTEGFEAATQRVHELEYNWRFEYTGSIEAHHYPSFVSNIGSWNNITRLTLFIPSPANTTQNVRLESLRILSFATAEGVSPRLHDLHLFISWDLPQLSELRFRPFIDMVRVPGSLVAFICKQPGLRILDLGCCSVNSLGPADTVSLYACVQEALTVCPAIRHVVLPARFGNVHLADSPLLDEPLEHVDVWTSLRDTRTPALRPARWRSLRLLDNGLSPVLDLPHLLPPWCVAPPPHEGSPRAAYVHDVFGLRIVETERSVVRQDVPWEHALGDANIYTIAAPDFQFGDAMDMDVKMDDLSASSDSDVGSLASIADCDSDVWSTEDVSETDMEFLLHGRHDHPAQITSEEALEIFNNLLEE
ncbi:hypothetical protein PHLGIDRAFT_165365 [Phlebiopsis gigantea 11061_1 CR5-6]|uniref:F-box domain-containing protein n=1 Tax=Phlebiopsis gigantea (strain 11061_1 CR5-6) TaxID=745531 RepID=A0A0C3NJQ0_PHLG1|nr:hypothetical protein PHLGIDRAFT_165365 [Phlebiopsis gigantea 11061_1 CR5-6]